MKLPSIGFTSLQHTRVQNHIQTHMYLETEEERRGGNATGSDGFFSVFFQYANN